MLIYRIYYQLKPLIPRFLQITLRRQFICWKRQFTKDIWPIDEKAKGLPPGCCGWPGGKKFAILLSHDVETGKGLRKSRQLAELEESLGFRSSFNFVPEDYLLPPELRNHLVEKGFEIGVHGLRHDGKLFASRKIFRENAIRINQYLKSWNSVGFHSPSMHHRLEWIHDLDIEYDVSTFDTDPFEPQPDGVGTIFPFCVPGNSSQKEYVEFPYTLPQDFTLFVLMREKSIDIWKQKLDWVAKHGGMALLNTHPDYMHSKGEKHRIDEYPIQYYKEFLEYVKDKYEGQYWHALPKEVARFWKEKYGMKQKGDQDKVGEPIAQNLWYDRRKKATRIAMVALSYYPADVRVRREAEALAQVGISVDVICLRDKNQVKQGEFNQVSVYRLPVMRKRSGKLRYLRESGWFFLLLLFNLTLLHLRKRYDLIHVHNMPDFLVFGALIPRLTGAKIILDLHDPMPELYETKYSLNASHPFIHLITSLERYSIRFADLVLTPNIAFRDLFISRGCPPSKIHIVMNSPQETIFNLHSGNPPITGKNGFVIMYHGYIVAYNGLATALEAVALLREKIPNLTFEVYGDGDFREKFLERVNELRLNGIVNYHGFKPLEDIVKAIGSINLGIIPNKMSPFTNLNFPTRIFEYLAMKKPVIAPRTKGIMDYFDENSLLYFEAGNVDSLKETILDAYHNPSRCQYILNRGITIYNNHRWELYKQRFIDLVENILRTDNAKEVRH